MTMININLIAERRARKIHELNVLRWATIGVLLVLLIALTFNVYAWGARVTAQDQVNTEIAQLEDLRADQDELLSVAEEIRRKGPVVDLLEQVRISEGAWMTILGDLSRVIPHDALLTNVSTLSTRDGVSLKLTGRARDQETVGDFMLAVRQYTKWAEKPKLSSINAVHEDDGPVSAVRYDFSVPVQGLLGGDFK